MALPKRVMVISDVHIPYHREPAWELTKKCIYLWKPDLLFVLGDFFDFYSISDFDRDPMRRHGLQLDIDTGREELATIRKRMGNMRILFLPGNHEHRLQRYLWKQAPELAGLRSLELGNLLEADRLDIEMIPRGQPYRIGELLYLHGDELKSGSQHPAKGKGEKAKTNIIFGHNHKFDVYPFNTLDGRNYCAWANACLCSLKPDWMLNPQWQNGFSRVYYHSDGTFGVEQQNFFNSGGELVCLMEGQRVSVSL